MRKILIIGPAWVGDMVMAQSLFKLLQAEDPTVCIHVAAPRWTLPLVSRMPEVAGTIDLSLAHGELALRKRYQMAKKIREQKFDEAIVLPNSFKSALIPWWANIPKRTGWSRELRSLLLNDVRRLDKKRYPLMIERFLALGLSAGAPLPAEYPYPALTTSETMQAAVLAKLGMTKPTVPVLALCPGAEFGPSKRWPEASFAALAQQQLAAGWQVWLLGSPKDKAVTEKIMALTDNACVDFAGRTHLEEAVDLLAQAHAVVSNDSGLMHVAAALKKPLVALYGSTSPDFTPPLSETVSIQQLNLACQPCFKRECPLQHQRCLRGLLPAQVSQALLELL